MARAVLCALAAALLATSAAEVQGSTTISGSFTVRDWDFESGDPSTPPGALFLAYSVNFDPTQRYTDARDMLDVAAEFPFTLGFSFNPLTSRMVLATHGTPDGCSHPAASFCAIIDDFLANEPWRVVLAQDAGDIWAAGTIDPGDGRVSPPGVPEPSAWAMLIAGFGLVGAMRRRRGQLAA
jgi:hypothetical protein